jgi:hypothetical protein
MGLFSFFNRKNGSTPNFENGRDIPEHVFIEKDAPNGTETVSSSVASPDYGISLLFQFLEKNYEAKGYDDALVNPDTTHLEQNVFGLRNDLQRTIRKVKLFYEDFIREIDVHISTRQRSGMIDTVEELSGKRLKAQSHIEQVIEIENEANNNQGIGQGIVISYTRGFRNGLAAISHHSILRKNF